MPFFLKKKKTVSALLILFLLVSLSPIFAIKTDALGAGAAQVAAGAGIVATAGTVGAASCLSLGILSVGSGQICDVGVRYNTLQMLSATMGVGPGVAQKEAILDSYAYFAARILIRQLTQSIVNWINSGFQGNPSFIQDPKQFMANTADRTIGEFIYSSDLKFLCSPFETNIRLALGLQYMPFKDKINCTLSSVLKNVDNSVTDAYNNFMNGDFINGGGWDSWLNITTIPQNNQLGAMIIAQAELDARIGDIQLAKANELNWSGGLLSMKECTRRTYNSDGKETGKETYSGDAMFQTVGTVSTTSRAVYANDAAASGDDYTGFSSGSGDEYVGSTQDTCQIVTPGTWITGTGNKVMGWDLDRLGVADELDEIVGALANYAITKIMEKGMAMVTSEDLSADDADWQAGIAALQSQQNSDISNAVSAAASGSSYTPSYSSYTGTVSTVSGGTVSGTTDISSSKNVLLANIAYVKIPEQAYFDAYSSIYTTASSTQTKLLGVVNCYETKLASTTLSLTASERNTASDQIDIASTTASSMASTSASVVNNINTSYSNLINLQTISTNVTNASTISALQTEQTNLSNLSPSLHTSDQALTAQSTASTTLSQINTASSTAATMQTECNVFPN